MERLLTFYVAFSNSGLIELAVSRLQAATKAKAVATVIAACKLRPVNFFRPQKRKPFHAGKTTVDERSRKKPCESLSFIKKFMRTALLLFALVSVLTSSGQRNFTSAEFASLKWLEGSWKGTTGKEPFYEAWRLVNDSVLVNFAIEIKGTDTLVSESNGLLLRGGRLVLGKGPVQWTATRLLSNEIVLKNDSAAYSNTILWLHTRDDHWFTILEHPKSTAYYDMTRDAALDKKVEEWIKAKQKERKN